MAARKTKTDLLIEIFGVKDDAEALRNYELATALMKKRGLVGKRKKAGAQKPVAMEKVG